MSWYSAGSVAVTNGSATIIGTGTSWVRNVRVGDAFRGPDKVFHEVSEIVSDTEITLATAYDGVTASGASYTITPTTSHDKELVEGINGILRKADKQSFSYATRADLVTAQAAESYIVGAVAHAGGISYRYTGSGAAIADLPGWVPNGDVTPDHWATNTTPGTTNMTTAIQAAIDYVRGADDNLSGGQVHFGGETYAHTGITLKDRVFLVGAGRSATTLYLLSGSESASLTIPADADVFGWNGLSFHGNDTGNTLGHGIHFLTATSGGDYGAEVGKSFATGTKAYKHCTAYDFAVGFAAEDGIRIETANYKVFFDQFSIVRCGRDGLFASPSDCIFSNFYIERNRRCGLYATGSNNKYINGKSIWSGAGDASLANIYVTGSYHKFTNVETQDGYCDGWSVGGTGHSFVGCTGNRNGYLAEGSEAQSSSIHTDLRIRSGSAGLRFYSMKLYTYATAVGTDGKWTTQWPYYFDAFSSAQVEHFDVLFDAAKYNAKPNAQIAKIADSNVLSMNCFSSDAASAVLDLDLKAPATNGNKTVRFFRSTTTGGTTRIDIHDPGTANVQHRFGHDGVTLCALAGDTIIGNGAWNGQRMRLGSSYLWVDASGRLRIKATAPVSDTDGTVVGAQV